MSMKKKRHVGFGLLRAIVAAAVILYSVIGYLPPASAQNPGLTSTKDDKPIPTSTEKTADKVAAAYVVKNEDIVKNVILTGELRAEVSTSITAPMIQSSFSNSVTFLAPEGSIVKKGERIVEFDDSSLVSQRSEAERSLDEAKLSILKKKADLEAQRCDLLNSVAQAEAKLKQDELYGKISKDLQPANTYQKYQLNVTTSKLSLQKAKEQLDNFEKSYASQMALAEINRSQAEINLKKIQSDTQLLKIDAPQDGILVYGDNRQSRRKVQTGDSIFPGEEIVRLPDLSTMEVIGYVYDTEYSILKPNMRCTVKLDALPDFEVGGVLVSMTSVAGLKGFTSEKKVFQAVVRLDKVNSSVMKPGMTARVILPLILASQAPAIPREYIGVDALGRDFILKGKDIKTASVQFVKVGAIGDRMVQAVTGVSAGDSLIPSQLVAEVSK
jgi:HlyD family secretion protein